MNSEAEESNNISEPTMNTEPEVAPAAESFPSASTSPASMEEEPPSPNDTLDEILNMSLPDEKNDTLDEILNMTLPGEYTAADSDPTRTGEPTDDAPFDETPAAPINPAVVLPPPGPPVLEKSRTGSATIASGSSDSGSSGESDDQQHKGAFFVAPALDDDDEEQTGKKRSSRPLVLLALALAVLVIGFGVGMGIQARKNSSAASSTESSSNAADHSPLTDRPTYTLVPAPTSAPIVNATVVAPTTAPPTTVAAVITEAPSKKATPPPTQQPTNAPVAAPSDAPIAPTNAPVAPTNRPTNSLTSAPTNPPPPKVTATYVPGNLVKYENNLLLSEGLTSKLIAVSGDPVQYHDGSQSSRTFHYLPDGGAAFPDTRDWNIGGWVYASNSEMKEQGQGGVGAITFNKDGHVVDYRMVLENTTMNCAGGKTPWNTWVSCEEIEFHGKAWQVDPLGLRPPEMATIGAAGGRWEAFAFDDRNKNDPRFFLSEDHNKGTVRRFAPFDTHWGGDEWKMLHEDGVIDYLLVHQNANKDGGTFEWTNDIEAARNNAREFFPQSEGIDRHGSKLYLVCKRIKQLFIFDLDDMSYVNMTTTSGLFDGSPDQMKRVIDSPGGLLYFTEEGGVDAGVHARDENGRFFTILESPHWMDETTGLSFSPDGKHMYIAWQLNGTLYDIEREDGLSFDAQALNVKYHSLGTRRLHSQWHYL